MATKLGSNNEFPKVKVVETASASIATPAAGLQSLFIDTSDHHLKRKNSSGTVTDLEGSQAPVGAQYLTLATDGTLTSERVATAGKNISLTDAGAGSTATFALAIPLTDEGNSGTALTIDFLSKPRGEHRFTLTGNVTLTLSNPIDGGVYTILVDTGAGGFSVTWPGSVLWPSATGPTITVTASKTDLITLIYRSGTSKYLGSFNQNY